MVQPIASFWSTYCSYTTSHSLVVCVYLFCCVYVDLIVDINRHT